jgi:Acyl-CoA reductase (LuxC)
MTVAQVTPFAGEAELSAVLAGLHQAGNRVAPPFSDEMVGFCEEFSKALFKDPAAQQFPEVQALAFWMRRTELTRMREDFAALVRQDTVLAPRGLVFHIPPANVDTIFVYSWLVAALTGNRNIIRLPLQVSPPAAVICRTFNDLLKTAGPALRENTVMIRYGHEKEITAQISAVADVRILWGGEETIRTIRAVPLPPHATELTFADRYSFAVIHAGRFLAADSAQRKKLAGAFFNDVFWFDQMACSSPRLIVWQGEPAETAAAGREFLTLLKAHAESKSYQVPPATRLSRFVYACGAIIDQAARTYQDLEAFTVVDVGQLQRVSRNHCGGGLLFQHRISALDELIPFVDRRDQTMTYFGFEPGELRRFACQLNGRGVDRIVPAGQALQFHRFWDGYDLFQELTRHVYIGA